jgi:signal transduction histidine kinase
MTPDPMNENFTADIRAINQIDAVPRILEVICRTTGLRFAAVARVTESRWIACAVRDEIAFGLKPRDELVIGTTFCDEIRQTGEPVVIDNCETDEVFNRHPTPLLYGFKSYISVPVYLEGGSFFGTLCALDPRPARLKTLETVEMFKLFASLIAMHLNSQERLAASETALTNEREMSRLREQFIAVLGHDLRNPLSAIQNGTILLAGLTQHDQADEVRGLIERSISRMTELIENVLDFARGRLGGGLLLEHSLVTDLDAVLHQVVKELESTSPERTVHFDIHIGRPIVCSSARLAQLLSNILANAFTHGDPTSPIHVKATLTNNTFQLSVSNHGETIRPEVAEQLFQPFVRGSARPGQQGLGLGLYIASEIARAHDGTLKVTSSHGETCFTFEMPLTTDFDPAKTQTPHN